MKPLYSLLCPLAALAVVSCSGRKTYSAADFDREVYAPAHTSNFDIRGRDDLDATLITVRNPWQGAEHVEQHLLVLHGDTPSPVGFDGQTVRAPVRRVVCLSSSHIALFDALGEVDRIKGVSGIDYISNSRIRSHRLCGEVRDVGYDSNLDFELLAAMRPHIVLLYGVTGENTLLTGKLRELGIPYLHLGEYLEPSPLGKAEWLMIAAELCGCRDRGEEVFRGIVERYTAVAHRMQEYIAAEVPDIVCLPKVLLNTPYRDTWFMPPARNYMVRLIRDAGGDTYTVSEGGNASQPVDLEQAYLLAADADVWLNVGSCNTLAQLKARNPKFADMPAVRSGRVYNNNRRQTPAGGSDFWESGTVHPDLILRDLAAILHPASGSDSLIYYKRLE
ncbi:MAG: ABC transporter substrate-binding protein [Alistipes senegalensis]|nr:ABC transporter substrate-binding protein [Alistipes senegalensis]